MEDSSDSLFVYAGRLRRWTHRTRRPGAPASIPSPQPQNKSENHFIMYRYWKGRGESLGRPKAARDTGRAGSRLRGYLSAWRGIVTVVIHNAFVARPGIGTLLDGPADARQRGRRPRPPR